MSGCADICLSMDFGGSNEFYSESMPKARKAHTCCECYHSIPVGVVHHRANGKCYGEFFTNRTCAVCHEVRLAFTCGSWTFGDLWECIREEMFPLWHRNGPFDCLAKLTTPEAVACCTEEFNEWLYESEFTDAPGRTPEASP